MVIEQIIGSSRISGISEFDEELRSILALCHLGLCNMYGTGVVVRCLESAVGCDIENMNDVPTIRTDPASHKFLLLFSNPVGALEQHQSYRSNNTDTNYDWHEQLEFSTSALAHGIDFPVSSWLEEYSLPPCSSATPFPHMGPGVQRGETRPIHTSTEASK